MKIATVTAVYNEEDLIGQYLRHYEPQVDKIFLLDNGSSDRTLEIARTCPKVEVSSFHTPEGIPFDGPKHVAVMDRFNRCRGEYDYVLLVDADEFIISRVGGPIREILEKLPEISVFRTNGFSMVTLAEDLPYDPLKPLPEQRRVGFPDKLYSKPCIARPYAFPIFARGIHSVAGITAQKISVGAFLLLHYPGPTDEIFLKRRLGKEPRIHKKPKTQEHFTKLLASWRARPELALVV